MAVLWTFRCYVSTRGIDEIRTWYDDQSATVRAKFDSRLKFLAQRERAEWKREPFDILHDECEGLGEIRFKADGVQHRPLGFFNGEKIFTLVLCAEEKGNKFVPKKACEIALRRKAEVLNSQERWHVCTFDLE
ncbi:MAG TPA: type II toxin-antitoxin system RelE/ParE family toxin [Patescibacteria group bacterium]|nr:type II toxin-antitoxin system RelE/ParE family toxin [Patescibacteria group bacterium]